MERCSQRSSHPELRDLQPRVCSRSLSEPSACRRAACGRSELSENLQEVHSRKDPSPPAGSGTAARFLKEDQTIKRQKRHKITSAWLQSECNVSPSSTASVAVRSQWLRLRLRLSGVLPSFWTKCLTRPHPTTEEIWESSLLSEEHVIMKDFKYFLKYFDVILNKYF